MRKKQFRMAKDYVKSSFKPFQKQISKNDKTTFKAALINFCDENFPEVISELKGKQLEVFLDQLVLPLYCSRSQKTKGKHPYLDDFEEDSFDVVRDVCDSYSEIKMRAYFEKPTLAFLFIWFSNKGKKFVNKKLKDEKQ